MTPTKFMPTFPCFSIFDDEGRGPVIVETTDGAKALVVLTDEDLLKRYRLEHEETGPAIRYEFATQMGLFVDSLVVAGVVTEVAFDPGMGKATTVAAAELTKWLLEALK